MSHATIIYPHQLFKEHPALSPDRLAVLVEEPLLLTEYETHAGKLLLHRLSLTAYASLLRKEGFEVLYIEHTELRETGALYKKLADQGITHVHIVDTTDYFLERRIEKSVVHHGLTRVRYESPLFILSKEEAMNRYTESKRHLARFYKKLRIDREILVHNGEPLGGIWSFDRENRKALPTELELPHDPSFQENTEITEARIWLKGLPGTHYGNEHVWLPYTHKGAETWLQNFLKHRFQDFGTYEDAISDTHTVLFHSVLSPLLNIGLLTPTYVLKEALAYAQAHNTPRNSVEGFVRQILGWREFIRASYECDGVAMRTKNFWKHTKKLPQGAWDGTTGTLPVDVAIARALSYGYTHHIERLMVLGNYFLLRNTDPHEVYRWFMAMYVDAYDWVMVPNVYGMSQFADGGLFATKPYISGSNYIRKMSHYPKGTWEKDLTALYWNFIHTHQAFFAKNHRLSMMPKLLQKMDASKREECLRRAQEILK